MSSPKLQLNIQNHRSWENLPSRKDFQYWISHALFEDADLTFKFVDTAESAQLNHYFRGKKNATNVLTFPYPETRPITADIALCVPVMIKEAHAQKKELSAHFAHLSIHATLHAQQFDHGTKMEREFMELLEIDILDGLGFKNPY